jgi:3-oxoisoapionate decarboxylase
MNTELGGVSRRDFVRVLGGVGLGLGASLAAGGGLAAAEVSSGRRRIKLGVDNFAVRAMKWNAAELVDYAASLRVDVLFITDLGPFRSFEDGYLGDLRKKAADEGVEIWLGSWSICPTSRAFRADWGTAEEHLALGLRMARALGSPVFRCILGTREDRRSEGGIAARIQDTVKVLRACRTRALDAGVKVAVENHAGDLQASELVTLIEEAGREYVGANMDSGNATWTLEDPLDNLEVLGPYVVCTSLRDSMIWESEKGARVQWTAMGEGLVDWKAYFDRFAQLCPGVPVNIETISGFSVEFPYLEAGFWDVWPDVPARGFARFVSLAKRGKALPSGRPEGQSEQDYQRGELERSIRFCRDVCGLGVRT